MIDLSGLIGESDYVYLKYRDRKGRHIREHIVIAEYVLGRPMPKGAVVHHVNEIKNDNRPCNLVICPNAAYHQMLHLRRKALKASGHASYKKCCCGKYDNPKNMNLSHGRYTHSECRNLRKSDWVKYTPEQIKTNHKKKYYKNRDKLLAQASRRHYFRKEKELILNNWVRKIKKRCVEASRNYRERPKRTRISSAKYYTANAEEKKQNARNYRKTQHAKDLIKKYKTTPEYKLAQSISNKKRYKNNRKKILAQVAKYNFLHREKRMLAERARRVRLKNND